MGSFKIDYETTIKPKLMQAIEDALNNEVKDAAIRAITDSASRRVYEAYDPVFYSRRYSLLDDETYEAVASGNTLTITAHPTLQNLYGGSHNEDLGDIIAEGWTNFFMPFPRPWMDEGIYEGLVEIEEAIGRGLQRHGF